MNEHSEAFYEALDHVLKSESLTFSKKELVDDYGLNERSVRGLFYTIKDMGLIVLNDGDLYTLVTHVNIDDVYQEALEQWKSDYRKALKIMKRVHKQRKSLPQKYQDTLEREVLE